jgi:hypothetical protein
MIGAAFPEKLVKRLFDDAATRALGVLHLAHRLVLLAAHAAPKGGFTISITASIEAFV